MSNRQYIIDKFREFEKRSRNRELIPEAFWVAAWQACMRSLRSYEMARITREAHLSWHSKHCPARIDETEECIGCRDELRKRISELEDNRMAIKSIIDAVENRCLAADGPVTNTRIEMRDSELQRIYQLCGGKIEVEPGEEHEGKAR